MTYIRAIRAVAVISSGLMAGLLFGDWLGPAFARAKMNMSSTIEFQQIIHTNYLLTLPALSTIALGTAILWMVMVCDRRGEAEFKALFVAAIAIAIGYTITLVFNVPVNNALETWKAAAPPANARDIWNRWEEAHVVRTVFWMAGFFLETIALACATTGRDSGRQRV